MPPKICSVIMQPLIDLAGSCLLVSLKVNCFSFFPGAALSVTVSVLVFQVRDVRMISDRNSRRSKGIAYVEFVDVSSVPLAIGLTGQRVLGVPIIVQASQVRT